MRIEAVFHLNNTLNAPLSLKEIAHLNMRFMEDTPVLGLKII